MALRAGYYGVKRRIKDKIEEIAAAWDTTIASLFPRSEQAVLGAKNLLPSYSGTYTTGGVTYTADANGVVTCSGTATGTSFWRKSYGSLTLKKGKYKIYGGPDIATFAGNDVFVGLWNGTTYITPDAGTTDTYTFTQDTSVQFTIRIGSGIDISSYVFYPMIRLATDPDDTYVPYAMTNRELTLSEQDQKTAINAIITAATSAADFTAFKTAMGAITPVSRSLSMAAPEEIVKDEIEDPVVEKKTTKKKSTAKAETTEEV